MIGKKSTTVQKDQLLSEYLDKTNVKISYLQAKRITLDCVPSSGIKYDVRFFSFAGNMIGRSI